MKPLEKMNLLELSLLQVWLELEGIGLRLTSRLVSARHTYLLGVVKLRNGGAITQGEAEALAALVGVWR